MFVSIFGLGYVGSVMAACLADRGHTVVGVDVNPLKLEQLAAGRTPIVEPGMESLVAAGVAKGLITTTSDADDAVRRTEISFICVGTPSRANGSLDLAAVQHVCSQIGAALKSKTSPHTVVCRSTMLPGTSEKILIPLLERASGKLAQEDFFVCSNPEFLREGSAIVDFANPPMTVVGADSEEHAAPVMAVYKGVPGPRFILSIPSAELVKYACNVFHAVKVAFANEIGTIGCSLGVDVNAVAEVFCTDTKLNISPAYLRPGFAFGGSCLPKDVRALAYRAKELDLKLPLVQSLLPSNEEHVNRAITEVMAGGSRKIGMLGLSFKANTDDLRESPYVAVVKRLIGEGCSVRIWDPNVCLGVLVGSNRQFIEDTIPHIGKLLTDSLDEVLAFGDTIVIATSALEAEAVRARLRPEQKLVNLVRLEPLSQVPTLTASIGV
jgi:GDP-mannose 6-dehydrogenase